jgi:hypothetical protein
MLYFKGESGVIIGVLSARESSHDSHMENIRGTILRNLKSLSRKLIVRMILT